MKPTLGPLHPPHRPPPHKQICLPLHATTPHPPWRIWVVSLCGHETKFPVGMRGLFRPCAIFFSDSEICRLSKLDPSPILISTHHHASTHRTSTAAAADPAFAHVFCTCVYLSFKPITPTLGLLLPPHCQNAPPENPLGPDPSPRIDPSYLLGCHCRLGDCTRFLHTCSSLF
jgi:hypothetical protein